MKFVSATEVNSNRLTYYIIDVREQYEFEFSHISSENIPMADVIKQLEILPRDKKVVLICNSGNRAEPLANLLEVEHHFDNIYVMKGGIVAWKDEVDNTLILE
ncbi:MAG: rhodanese-like domain-containing protein [Crocinitomicaceae bacterium]|nr:rhodanese-like domain-containing protein [Crocinitomicaceae bacterium]